MKVYIAKDWRGPHVYSNPPSIIKNLSAFPLTWTGHELKEFNITGSFAEDEIPRGKYLERNIMWSIVHILK